eukprot:824577-Amphidinium_carterae.1
MYGDSLPPDIHKLNRPSHNLSAAMDVAEVRVFLQNMHAGLAMGQVCVVAVQNAIPNDFA